MLKKSLVDVPFTDPVPPAPGHVGGLRGVHLRRAFRAPSELPIGPRVLPEPQRDWKRIDVEPLPPAASSPER